ncbi:anti-sigma F factor antagonist [Clostridium fallax]|uniref:Anti-sigma F factor antagonist n=1 Tax=Clostridium fallax TaxID=1533 RepID=A0A1M4UHV8_9CLOT|nr:anti-sigma F factor antagonist [Clostridium fallax]SHE56287.1 anti-anti-sigma regulatory factor, SpoIIAA [Clostridium fallax]SQB07571.1 anti-sigma F factor antagonist [Clostridium fallax]
MYLKFDNINNNLIVTLMGELDHHSAEEVRIKIDDRIDRDNFKNLIMDFSGVSFMDSSGIGVVIGRYKKVESREGKVLITSLTKNVKRIFELSGIFKIINTYNNVEEAISSI